MNQIPFAAQFAEDVPEINMSGIYDPKLQMFLPESKSFEAGHTTTETATGGWNDTDSDVD